MSNPSAKCPNPQCGCPVGPSDLFCPYCGQSLPESAATGELGPGSPSTPSSKIRGEVGPGCPSTPSSKVRAAMGGELPSDCADLEVLYNNSCVFVLGMQATFDVEIRACAEGLHDLCVEIRQSGQVIAREKPSVRPRPGRPPLVFGLNYTPRNTHPGKVSFEIRVAYRKDGQPRVYAAYRTHTIYSGKEDPRQVCESLVIEVKNNIQQGHAGDVRVDQSFKELRELVKGRSGMEIDRDFLHLINTRPYWAPLALAECATEVDAGADAERRTVGRPGRLALESACGARVHLLTDARAQIGRSRDCEILARVLDDAGRQLDEPSRRISRYHACLEWEAESCRIVDRGYHADAKVWKPSASGTWVDGRRLAAGGEFRFAPGREYQVALGDPAAAGGPVFQFAARLWLARDVPNVRPGCPDLRGAPDAPACLALRRVGGPPEHYLLVRRAASLAWVDARCGAACVCARLDGLHFSDGHGCDPLIPGRTVRAGSLDLRVTAAKPPAPAGI